MILELDRRIRQELLKLYGKMYQMGELCLDQELERYYTTFRQKWEPDKLLDLNDEGLLNAMHGPGKESLAYWLEFKDDEEFPSDLFGSIAGGSAFKFGLFRKKDTGAWITGSAQNQVVLSLEQAINKAKQHRDQLITGCKLLAELPGDCNDEDYELLQQKMDELAPDVSNTSWGHKYFSLIYPNKLDSYHDAIHQHFHLIQLLQVPPQMEGRYVASGRYITIASNLNMAVNTLIRLLNVRSGGPHSYWRIGTYEGEDRKSKWEKMRLKSICSIGWVQTGDLSAITNDDAGMKELRALLQKAYPDKDPVEINRISRQIFDFRWTIKRGDRILASDGATVLGIGQVTGDYFYDATRDFAHCRSVKWFSLVPWQQPDQNPYIEGRLTSVYRMRRTLNLIETEKRILEAKYEIGPIFADQKLSFVPEPLLTKSIIELRHHLFVEEALVRRIYHALLNGHVILTGPPGTGKTELARLIPEILWRSEKREPQEYSSPDVAQEAQWGTHTAYASTLVTATNRWSTRTLISGMKSTHDTNQHTYGYLTEAILRNWVVTEHSTTNWEFHGRRSVQALSAIDQELTNEYRGHWLIIDELNRAPIDAALRETLIPLSNDKALRVPVDGTVVHVPLPQDFRIIGTLNSFDRNYLTQISEALKRRFAFIEILPPTRVARSEEQGIVLFKTLKNLAHLSPAITITATAANWLDVVTTKTNDAGIYEYTWNSEHPLSKLFHQLAWPLFEVLRVYHQLGTAQAIALISRWFTPGLLQQYTNEQQWLKALDMALCDTLAGQLQVLLPDEREILLWHLELDASTFTERYNNFLANQTGERHRLVAHLETLRNTVTLAGKNALSDQDVENLLRQKKPYIAPTILREVFHLDHSPYQLPEFARRLRIYELEDGEKAQVEVKTGSVMLLGAESELILRATNSTGWLMGKIDIELYPSAEYDHITSQRISIPSLSPGASVDVCFKLRMKVSGRVSINHSINGVMRDPAFSVYVSRDNPYIYGSPVDEGEFFGRQEELETIVQAVTKPAKQDILVVGERRSGKTSLLYQAKKYLANPFIAIYIVLNTCRPRTDDVLEHVLCTIIQNLIDREILESTWHTHEFASNDFTERVDEVLQEVKRTVENPRLILFLDEADFLLEIAEENNKSRSRLRVDERVQRVLRAALQSHKIGGSLSAVVAGTTSLSTYMLENSSPFFNHFRYIHLKSLSLEETRELIIKPAEILGVTFSPNAIERISSLGGRQPYYCQALCYEAFACAQRRDIKLINDSEVDVAEQKIRDDLSHAFLSGIWRRATRKERAFLAALVRGEASPSTTNENLQRLLDWQIVVRAQRQYCFSAGLLEQWTAKALKES